MDNSAKLIDENEVTPQSNYVFIYDDSRCQWDPRYEMSVTQCPVDVTWFPFDRQECEVSFESWLLKEPYLNLVINNKSIDWSQFVQPDDWLLTGTFGYEDKVKSVVPHK